MTTKKLKIQIVSWLNGSVLFEYETKDNTVRKTLEEAVSRGANLRGANLWRADLWRAKGLQMYWHIHHEILVENLMEPLKNRIKYIKEEKPKDEVKLRLKLLKKVECKIKDYPVTKAGWEKLHKKECKKCSWNGKTIFQINKGGS